jgi:hypothetical protein
VAISDALVAISETRISREIDLWRLVKCLVAISDGLVAISDGSLRGFTDVQAMESRIILRERIY